MSYEFDRKTGQYGYVPDTVSRGSRSRARASRSSSASGRRYRTALSAQQASTQQTQQMPAQRAGGASPAQQAGHQDYAQQDYARQDYARLDSAQQGYAQQDNAQQAEWRMPVQRPKHHRAGRIALVCVLACLAVAGGVGIYLYRKSTQGTTNIATAAKQIAWSSGVGDTLEGALNDNSGQIANLLGVSDEQVQSTIDSLDISSWQVTDVPSDAVASGTFDTTYSGQDITVTTYNDPSYVTVDAGGTSTTFLVSDAAKGYISQYAALVEAS